MLIDWFTVAAQALNFVVLVWLLKRFLYKPVLDAIDARERRIAKELADADARKAEAQQERDEFQHRNAEFDRQRNDMLTSASREAGMERQRLLEAARQEADALRLRRQETLRNDARTLNQAISRNAQQEVFAIAHKTLSDLADVNLEQHMCGVFVRRLRALQGAAKSELARALQGSTQPVMVRSAFALPAPQRDAIQAAVNETFAADLPLNFQIDPQLVSGIELLTDGHRITWSIADYLLSIQESVGKLLPQTDQSRSAMRSTADPEPAAAQERIAPATERT